MDRKNTPCKRGCCWTPFGICGASYDCEHHRWDHQQRVRLATMPSPTPTALRFATPARTRNSPGQSTREA